mgnify:CR=1 FL=1
MDVCIETCADKDEIWSKKLESRQNPVLQGLLKLLAGIAAALSAGKPLTDAQVQKMLLTEHGGMNEVLADLYADTGDTRWLDLSIRFEHRAFTDALKRHQDNLSGKHGNCQIPKLIGSAARYGYTADSGGELPSDPAQLARWLTQKHLSCACAICV